MRKKKWLIIEPYVYINVIGEDFLLYNTINGDFVSDKHNSFIVFLNEILNCGINSIEINNSESSDELFQKLVSKIRLYHIGDIVLSEKRPIIFGKNLYFNSINSYITGQKENEVFDLEKLLISELSFYINSRSNNIPVNISNVFKQFNCSTLISGDEELILEDIIKVIDELHTSYGGLRKVQILGGDIFQYTRFSDLIIFLNGKKIYSKSIIFII